ncbi:MAG: murein L,D-transpeptidase catalytic domain family protein [Chitinophagaceae bacterium]
MKNLFVPILLACLSVSFTVLPTEQANNRRIAATNFSFTHSDIHNSTTVDISSALYDDMSLQQYGLSKEAFTYALKGYQNLLRKNLIRRTDYITVCDFSQSSKQKRLYLIDIAEGKLILNTYVAHGRNSGAEYATRFSNKPSSLQSSLGFYVTEGTYIGEHGLALKINGVDAGYNDKAYKRHIVIHGADYITEGWLHHSNYMGRSYGCPAIPKNESESIINTIKNGTCLFIYHPDKNYLLRSKILNG